LGPGPSPPPGPSPHVPGASSTNRRLYEATSDPIACAAWLGDAGVSFRPLADRDEGAYCKVRNAVALGDEQGGSVVRMSPRNPMMNCALAAALVTWRGQSVQPAARELLGAEVSGIDHFGVYACRLVNNQIAGRPSAHAQAAAIDIAGFRLSDGRRVSVEKDWPQGTPEAAFLHRVRDEACRVFSVTLSPDYNALHHNHLHLEMAGGGLCS